MVTEMGDRGNDSPDFARYFELWLDTIVPKPQIAKFSLRPIYTVRSENAAVKMLPGVKVLDHACSELTLCIHFTACSCELGRREAKYQVCLCSLFEQRCCRWVRQVSPSTRGLDDFFFFFYFLLMTALYVCV
jgi:hypothetical protein